MWRQFYINVPLQEPGGTDRKTDPHTHWLYDLLTWDHSISWKCTDNSTNTTTLYQYRYHCTLPLHCSTTLRDAKTLKHCLCKFFPSSGKFCAKFYAVLLRKWVISRFFAFWATLMIVNKKNLPSFKKKCKLKSVT